MALGEERAKAAVTEARLADAQAQLTQIRSLMATVAVYEGIADVSPLVLMVSDLAKDHAELERRIDQAILVCRAERGHPAVDEIGRMLMGGRATPDSPEGL